MFVKFYQINKCFVKTLFSLYWQNVFAGRSVETQVYEMENSIVSKQGNLNVIRFKIVICKQTISQFNHVYVCYVTVFSEWSSWSECSSTCDAGQRFRTRICSQPGSCLPDVHGTVTNATQECQLSVCPKWGSWTQFSECSVTCGNGTKTRTRFVPVFVLRVRAGDMQSWKLTTICS